MINTCCNIIRPIFLRNCQVSNEATEFKGYHLGLAKSGSSKHPLVYVYITNWKIHPFLGGKLTISTGPCSIANCKGLPGRVPWGTKQSPDLDARGTFLVNKSLGFKRSFRQMFGVFGLDHVIFLYFYNNIYRYNYIYIYILSSVHGLAMFSQHPGSSPSNRKCPQRAAALPGLRISKDDNMVISRRNSGQVLKKTR